MWLRRNDRGVGWAKAAGTEKCGHRCPAGGRAELRGVGGRLRFAAQVFARVGSPGFGGFYGGFVGFVHVVASRGANALAGPLHGRSLREGMSDSAEGVEKLLAAGQ